MATRLIIENQVVRQVEEIVHNEIPLSAIMEYFETEKAISVYDLPSSYPTRFLHLDPTEGTGLIVVEVPPAKRAIRINYYTDDTPEDEMTEDMNAMQPFNIMMPYSYFVFKLVRRGGMDTDWSITDSQMYWSPAPVRSKDDPIWVAAVPNVDSSAYICWGNTARPGNQSLGESIDQLINDFFQSEFNADLGLNRPTNSMSEWADEGPTDYLSWRMWNNEQLTVQSAILDNIYATREVIRHVNSELPESQMRMTAARAREWLLNQPADVRRALELALPTLEADTP